MKAIPVTALRAGALYEPLNNAGMSVIAGGNRLDQLAGDICPNRFGALFSRHVLARPRGYRMPRAPPGAKSLNCVGGCDSK